MKQYDVEVTLVVTIPVEAESRREAKELAINIAKSGRLENGVDDISARVIKPDPTYNPAIARCEEAEDRWEDSFFVK